MVPPETPISADLFCRVVDNLGDIGVMWRLARQLRQEQSWRVRLWVDHLESLATIEPRVRADQSMQTCEGVDIAHWPAPWRDTPARSVVIAGFSCDLPRDYLAKLSMFENPVWIQLEYLSAEPWTASFHGLHSQRNDRLKPVFFFPGFNTATGGLLREHDLITRRQTWIDQALGRPWLASLGLHAPPEARLVSVFTYPHAPVQTFIEQLQRTNDRFHLLIPTKTSVALQATGERVTWQHMAFLSQTDYDKLLWSCSLNLVRGEDSFVRAIWAGQPLLWQIYPQKDGVHHAKLQAWLDLAMPPVPVAQAMHEWADGALKTDLSPSMTGKAWQQWQQSSASLVQTLSPQRDLATRLDAWVRLQTVMSDGL
jgi:uncharacterized repeat protein (TIGR03837 family)